MSMKHTVIAQDVIAQQQCDDLRASITPYNLSAADSLPENMCNTTPPGTIVFDVPCYGKIPSAAHSIFTEEMKQIAELIGFQFPQYSLDKLVQSRMSKVKRAIDEWRLRPDFSDHHKALLDKLWAFADDFSKLNPQDINSPTEWKDWVEEYVGIGWEDRLHFNDVLSNFGFDMEVSDAMRAQTLNDSSPSVSLENHGVRWLSKALTGYKPDGCYTDVVNLVFAMTEQGSSGTAKGMTESQVVATLKNFSEDLARGTLEGNLWLPTHLVMDAEIDDMLVWVLLHYLHTKWGAKLKVRIQLPTSDSINDLANRLSNLPDDVFPDVEVFRDEGSRNEKAIMLTFGLG